MRRWRNASPRCILRCVSTSTPCSFLLLALAAVLAAEDVDVVTLKDGAVLVGVYDAAAHTVVMRGGASGTVVVDPAAVASVARKKLGDTAIIVPADWPTDTPESAALRQAIAEDQKKVDELGDWVAAVQLSLSKAKAAVEDTAAKQKDASDKLQMEKAVNGVTTRETEQKAADADAAAAKAAAAVPPLETELRTSQAKLELARRTLARDQERLDAPSAPAKPGPKAPPKK
jgi:hypothetical protein